MLGVDVTIEGQTRHIDNNSNISGSCSRNATVLATAFACRGCNFNTGNGGCWEIYDAAPFVLGSRCLSSNQ